MALQIFIFPHCILRSFPLILAIILADAAVDNPYIYISLWCWYKLQVAKVPACSISDATRQLSADQLPVVYLWLQDLQRLSGPRWRSKGPWAHEVVECRGQHMKDYNIYIIYVSLDSDRVIAIIVYSIYIYCNLCCRFVVNFHQEDCWVKWTTHYISSSQQENWQHTQLWPLEVPVIAGSSMWDRGEIGWSVFTKWSRSGGSPEVDLNMVTLW